MKTEGRKRRGGRERETRTLIGMRMKGGGKGGGGGDRLDEHLNDEQDERAMSINRKIDIQK